MLHRRFAKQTHLRVSKAPLDGYRMSAAQIEFSEGYAFLLPLRGKRFRKQQEIDHGFYTPLHVPAVTGPHEFEAPIDQSGIEFRPHIKGTFLIKHPEDTLADNTRLGKGRKMGG